MARKREVLPPPPHLHCVTTLPSKTNAPQFSVHKPTIKQRPSFVTLPISNDLF